MGALRTEFASPGPRGPRLPFQLQPLPRHPGLHKGTKFRSQTDSRAGQGHRCPGNNHQMLPHLGLTVPRGLGIGMSGWAPIPPGTESLVSSPLCTDLRAAPPTELPLREEPRAWGRAPQTPVPESPGDSGAPPTSRGSDSGVWRVARELLFPARAQVMLSLVQGPHAMCTRLSVFQIPAGRGRTGDYRPAQWSSTRLMFRLERHGHGDRTVTLRCRTTVLHTETNVTSNANCNWKKNTRTCHQRVTIRFKE